MADFDDEDDEFLSNVSLEQDDAVIAQTGPVGSEDSPAQRVRPVITPASCDQTEADFDDDDEDDQMLSSIFLEESISEAVEKEPEVAIPTDFPFPFEPYNIQKGFMKELYRCLELGKIGIFESPTGTGKSLSLICGALRWLKDFQERQKAELEALLAAQVGDSHEEKENVKGQENKDSSVPDWISEFKEKQEENEKTKKIKEELEHRLQREAKLKEIKTSRHLTSKRKRTEIEDEFEELMKSASAEIQEAYQLDKEKLDASESGLDAEDENLILADYNSDDDFGESEDNDGEETDVHCTKIYFCSRTHSQLSQFVREVVKSPYGEDTRVISLGSRQNLCINEAVKRLKSLSLINDTCRDLQKNKTKKKSEVSSTSKRRKTGAGCPYYKQDPIQEFKERSLVQVRDIEQLVTLGKQLKSCPYYGTRLSIPDAEIVALPYNTLLHKSTRESSGIQLKDNIVIIDEAHNLLETINNVHSTEVTGAQLVRAHSQLGQYEAKFRSRLKAQNLMYIKQILYILGCLVKCIDGKTGLAADKQKLTQSGAKLWTINDFLFHSRLDNINLFKVLRYCQRSLISKKLQGFVEKYPEETVNLVAEKKEETSTSGMSSFLKTITGKGDNPAQEPAGPQPTATEERGPVMNSPLMHIEGFLLALTNADKDGRIVIAKQGLVSQSCIKFLLLNPAVYFGGVVSEARAVIVAGGTMQPVSEFKDQLFHAAGVSTDRILEYSCGHVIAGEQLLPIAVSTGPTGISLDFTYQNRTRPSLLDELGRVVCNVCNAVPGGVVCFFPSYDYEKLVYGHWEKMGTIARLGQKKKVLREPRRAGQVDQVLTEYTSCIQNCGSWSGSSVTGSILFCVVGGKMSEGINFSDELGRCVLMVGMPYPNINSPELKEKMDYLNANFPRDKEGRQPGQVHYENLCMKAVNQSIGRAIRHRGDYATILMLDRRYSRAATVAKLPGWISKHLLKVEKFGTAFSSISKFFAGKKETN